MRFFLFKRLGGFLAALALLAACGGEDVEPLQPTDSTTDIARNDCAACAGDCTVLTASINDSHHTADPVVYSEQPPVGGPHNSCWLPWTVYTSEPQTERWVHNLEHGGVALLYNCPHGCEDDVSTMSAFASSLPKGRAIMLPYAEMDARFAMVAWGVSQTMACVDIGALQEFYDAHVNHGREDLTADPPTQCPP